jgi:hypothetical protein
MFSPQYDHVHEQQGSYHSFKGTVSEDIALFFFNDSTLNLYLFKAAACCFIFKFF